MRYVRAFRMLVPATIAMLCLAFLVSGVMYLITKVTLSEALGQGFRLVGVVGFALAAIAGMGGDSMPKIDRRVREEGELWLSTVAALVIASIIVLVIGELIL